MLLNSLMLKPYKLRLVSGLSVNIVLDKAINTVRGFGVYILNTMI